MTGVLKLVEQVLDMDLTGRSLRLLMPTLLGPK